jgi:hypothetical protein
MVSSHPCFARDNKIHCPRGTHYITINRWRGFFFIIIIIIIILFTLARTEFWSPQCRARTKSRERSVRERKPIPLNNSSRMVGRGFCFSIYSIRGVELCGVSHFSYNKYIRAPTCTWTVVMVRKLYVLTPNVGRNQCYLPILVHAHRTIIKGFLDNLLYAAVDDSSAPPTSTVPMLHMYYVCTSV